MPAFLTVFTTTKRKMPAFLIPITTTKRKIPAFLIPITTSSAAYSKLRGEEQTWSWSRAGSAFQRGMVFGLETFAKACSWNARGKYIALVKWHAQDGKENYPDYTSDIFLFSMNLLLLWVRLCNVRGWSPGIGRAWSINFNFGIKSLGLSGLSHIHVLMSLLFVLRVPITTSTITATTTTAHDVEMGTHCEIPEEFEWC